MAQNGVGWGGPEVPSQEGPVRTVPGSCFAPHFPLRFLPWPENMATLGGDLESSASLLPGDVGPVWPQWAFLFLVPPPPPVKNLSHEGNQEQGSGEGQCGCPEPGWAMPLTSPSTIPGGPGGEAAARLGPWASSPSSPAGPGSTLSVRSTFSALSQSRHLPFLGKPTSPKVPPSKSFLGCVPCPRGQVASTG